jgi:arsenite methyltransferase
VTGPSRDKWAEWILERRHGGDPEVLRHQLAALAPIRDRVLTGAALEPGQTVLDVGCGDGLIGFAAAQAVGPCGTVIFSDISPDLLEECRDIAARQETLERCRFVQARASRLEDIDDGAVDAVVLRSVLIYEADKAAAFSEFRRVLRPGGRLSLFEPIARHTSFLRGLDPGPAAKLMARVMQVFEKIQPADSDPMRNFDEQDLVAFAEGAGFEEIHLDLSLDVRRASPMPWQALLNIASNPLLPTLGEAMRQVLTADEAERLTTHLRPQVERGAGTRRLATAYLSAHRPHVNEHTSDEGCGDN